MGLQKDPPAGTALGDALDAQADTRPHAMLCLPRRRRSKVVLRDPEARKAEQWLDGEKRLGQTAIVTDVEQQILARALLDQMDLFEEVSRNVAASRSFKLVDHSAVAAWMHAELAKLSA